MIGVNGWLRALFWVVDFSLYPHMGRRGEASLWNLFNKGTNPNLWRRQWHPTTVLLPEKSDGRRSLVGCSPWDREESDMTERLHFHFALLCIGEGNGNPLQCSCLENPRDGVAQSRTRLKWLSSSNPNLRAPPSWPNDLLLRPYLLTSSSWGLHFFLYMHIYLYF